MSRIIGPKRSQYNWTMVVLVTVSALYLFEGCKHEPQIEPLVPVEEPSGGGGDVCDPSVVYFQQQVLPILISNCAVPGCHNVPTDDNDDIEITSYETLMASGNVQDGDLWEVINDNDPDDRMPPPPQNPLIPEQITLIGQWIQGGALNTSCVGAVCDTLTVTYSGTIVPLVQQRCLGCHSGGEPQGGLNFNSWTTLNAVAMDGRLIASVTHAPDATPMPPSGAMLPDCNIQQFLIWVADGAPNN